MTKRPGEYLVKLLIAFCVCITCTSVFAEAARVAVASNFSAPMKKIVDLFEQQEGHSISLIFGSSGKLFAQIMNGAPFDILLSADSSKPQKLEQAGKIVKGSRFTYATGSLVLWSREKEVIHDSANILKSTQFNKLALANPRLAPYGVAAKQTLQHLGLWTELKPKIVTGESISQTYQFVYSGNSELGFVAQSQVFSGGKLLHGSGWAVPPELHDPIEQQAVLLVNAKNNQAALDLITFLKSDKALKIMQSYGYR